MGECRGATPHCRGRGGVPHKHTGRVGGKNHVRQAQSRKGLQRGEPPTETQRQLPIAPSPPQPLHWLYTSFTRRAPVVPAKAGTSNPCPCWGVRAASLLPVWDVGAVREPPERHAIPNVPPNPNDNCPLRHRRPSPYIGCMRHSRAEYSSFSRRREPRIPASGLV